MLQPWFILALIGWFRGFFVEPRAGVDEEAGERGVTEVTGPGSWAMRRAASTGPPRHAVQRHFEPSRLAEDCQTRAYELVPVGRCTKSKVGTTGPRAEGVDREGVELVSQRGVAA